MRPAAAPFDCWCPDSNRSGQQGHAIFDCWCRQRSLTSAGETPLARLRRGWQLESPEQGRMRTERWRTARDPKRCVFAPIPNASRWRAPAPPSTRCLFTALARRLATALKFDWRALPGLESGNRPAASPPRPAAAWLGRKTRKPVRWSRAPAPITAQPQLRFRGTLRGESASVTVGSSAALCRSLALCAWCTGPGARGCSRNTEVGPARPAGVDSETQYWRVGGGRPSLPPQKAACGGCAKPPSHRRLGLLGA